MFRQRASDNYLDMCEIFSNTSATGINATTGSQSGSVLEDEGWNNAIVLPEASDKDDTRSPNW